MGIEQADRGPDEEKKPTGGILNAVGEDKAGAFATAEIGEYHEDHVDERPPAANVNAAASISYQIGEFGAGHVGERPLATEAETDSDLPLLDQQNPFDPQDDFRRWRSWELGLIS